MRFLVEYFAQRSFVANVLMFGLILAGVFFWGLIGKEERPEFALNWVRVTVPYPGASAEDAELFIIKPIEEQLKGLSGLYEVNGTAAFGRAQFQITTDPNLDNFQEKYQEIKDAVERAELPMETEDPLYDRFNSSEKAIVDIALWLDGVELLSVQDRRKLQEYALTFKNQMLSLPEVSGIESKGYLKPELQIHVDPDKLVEFELPMSEVSDQIQSQHLRTPLGAMKDKFESEVSLRSYLDTPSKLSETVVRKTLGGAELLLSDLARVEYGFERTTSIRKIQGHEAVVFNIQKSQGVGILEARRVVNKLTDTFADTHYESGIRMIMLDDESYSVRNRLSIIASNGLFGFLTILLILFFFLDFRSGCWVAMGLPFSLAFTLVCCTFAGYTINNITLAAVIIVLGIVVDDAIIVADSIAKAKKKGGDWLRATCEGVLSVLQPVIAGVLTTGVAFVPLLFFEGRFGLFVKYIPLVVAFMLLASLLESFFILPAHLREKELVQDQKSKVARLRHSLMAFLEKYYSRAIRATLSHRGLALLACFLFMAIGLGVYSYKLDYVMFPREQPKEFAIKVIAEEGVTRLEMAEKVRKLEQMLKDDIFEAVVGFRTVIGESRRGSQVQENRAGLRVEILPPSEQKTPAAEMMAYWEKEAKALPDFKEVQFLKSWWSSDSGSPIAIEILENNDEKRSQVSLALKEELEKLSSLKNVEIEKPLEKTEFALQLDKKEARRLGIDTAQLAQTVRSFVEGQILYRLYDEEEIDVRLTSLDKAKKEIGSILSMTVTNQDGHLVPISQTVSIEKRLKPANIQRVNYKRANSVYADLETDASKTPLQIASYLEESVFPDLAKRFPTTLFNFRGEIEDSREAQSDFAVSILMTLGLIYAILTFMFGSFLVPLLIGSIIPFGAAGVMFAFWGHGMSQYGFFAVIGTIGMLGVVINDSIVLVNSFESSLKSSMDRSEILHQIAEVSITRLRPVLLTTLTTVAGVFPTAYGLGGYDAMLSDMMLAMGWGLIFGTLITLFIIPVIYSFLEISRQRLKGAM